MIIKNRELELETYFNKHEAKGMYVYDFHDIVTKIPGWEKAEIRIFTDSYSAIITDIEGRPQYISLKTNGVYAPLTFTRYCKQLDKRGKELGYLTDYYSLIKGYYNCYGSF